MLWEKNQKMGGGKGNLKIFHKFCGIVVEMFIKMTHNIVESHVFVVIAYF
jgi:hypothetical protein